MFKKVLYVFTVLLVGFLVIMNTVLSNIVSEGKVMIEESLAEGEYIDAISFYGTWFDTDAAYKLADTDGQILQVYNAIADKYIYEYVEGTEGTDEEEVENYYIIKDNALNFMLFDVGSEFATSNDDEEAEDLGYVTLTFVDGSTYSVGLNNDAGSSYDYYSYYSFIPVTIYETTVLESLNEVDASLTEVPAIVSIEITDYDGSVHISSDLTESEQFSFESDIKSDFADIIYDYNQIILGELDLTDDELDEAEAELEDKVTALLEEKEYGVPKDISIVFGRSGFLVPTALVLGSYIIIVVILGYFVFRKKKENFSPVKRTTPIAKPVDVIEENSSKVE